MKKTAYLIGIKGVGMTALAVYLSQAKYDVAGSDNNEEYVTDKILKSSHIVVREGFNKKNLPKNQPDLLVVSAAYSHENVEYKEAIKRKFEVLYYSEALEKITRDKNLIAVAGVHGKTTISSLIAYILEKAKFDPSYIIGAGKSTNLPNSAHFGHGENFVLEADEYRKSPTDNKSKFLDISPKIAVISSIELDHPDVFSGIEEIYKAFYLFACRVSRDGFIVLCVDYPKAKKLINSLVDRKFETYGFDLSANWRIVDFKDLPDSTVFSLKNNNKIYGPFTLNIPGRHNALNATAAFIVAIKLGVAENVIIKSLDLFKGVKRRFETIGKINNITIIDDYAHHPTAIQKTLESVKEKFPGQEIWCIFQSHTYSRTKVLLKDFGESFSDVTGVIVADIYSSEREKDKVIKESELVNEIRKNKSNVRSISDWNKIKEFLNINVKRPAVIITIGAGDIYKLAQELLVYFNEEK